MGDIKITIGYRYLAGGAAANPTCRLIVTKNPVANSVECKCEVCGEVDTYKVSMLKKQEVIACKKCKGNIDIGKVYNEHLVIAGYTIRDKKFMVMVKCNTCGKTFILTKEQLAERKFKCIACSGNKDNINNKVTYAKVRASVKPVSDNKDNIKSSITPVMAKPKVEIKRMIPKSQADYAKAYEKETKVKIDRNNKIIGAIMGTEESDISKVEQIVVPKGDFVVRKTQPRTSKTGASITDQFLITCIKCGATSRKTEAELKRMQYHCKECESRTKDGRNIFKNINWIGFIKNNLEVVSTVVNSDGGVTCELKCLTCTKHLDPEKPRLLKLPLIALLDEESEFICPYCANVRLKLMCPSCGEPHIKATTSMLYCNKDVKNIFPCNKTGRDVGKAEVLLYHETLTSLDTLTNKYTNKYTLDYRKEGRGGFATILKFKEGYTGIDGEEYHTCMCAEHHKLLVLNNDEINTYRHEYCADTRMMPYNPKIKPKE